MDSMPVNWETLDALVIEFAKSEHLIEDDSGQSSPSASSPSTSSSYQSRLLIRQIRNSVEAGDIDAAVDLLRLHAPSVLDDHRLLFRLHKQKFVELLRKGTVEDRETAINCLRTALAPCALDAYPEAYEEFKHVLLAFIYDKDDPTSPVANEWSERRRSDIAGLLSSVLRAHLQAYDPLFSMTLRYLISIHKYFCFRQGISSPISDLTERLLLEERDPPATPQESLYEAPPFDEVDIQALAHAVELTRQGAVDSLKFAKGDLFQAFQNELCRMRLDVTVLDELVLEYCVYRGIVDSNLLSPSESQMQVASRTINCCQQDPGSFALQSSSLEVETAIHEATAQSKELEERYPCDMQPDNEDCSTSGDHQFEELRGMQRNRSQESGERNKRKRWRGRHEQLDIISDVCVGGKKDVTATAKKSTVVDILHNKEDKYEIVLGLRELASRGMAAEVVEEINAMDPNFFTENADLLFQLKQVEFLKLVTSGDHSVALKVASAHLGPLAARNHALLKPLKETLLALLKPNAEALGERLPLHALATSLQVAIGKRLGIDEPQIMRIIRTALYSHNEWFKLHMCKDRFEGLLKINSLKEIGSPLLADSSSKSTVETCTNGSSQGTQSSSGKVQEEGSSPSQMSPGDIACEENAILKVMEFLALPRADAIQLLAQYNGNAEAVIQQIFA